MVSNAKPSAEDFAEIDRHTVAHAHLDRLIARFKFPVDQQPIRPASPATRALAMRASYRTSHPSEARRAGVIASAEACTVSTLPNSNWRIQHDFRPRPPLQAIEFVAPDRAKSRAASTIPRNPLFERRKCRSIRLMPPNRSSIWGKAHLQLLQTHAGPAAKNMARMKLLSCFSINDVAMTRLRLVAPAHMQE